MTYAVVVESSAGKNIDDAFRWMVTNISPESATLWYLDIWAAMDSLKDFPARCGLAIENQFFKEEIRQLFRGKYRILFEIDGGDSESSSRSALSAKATQAEKEEVNWPVRLSLWFDAYVDSAFCSASLSVNLSS